MGLRLGLALWATTAAALAGCVGLGVGRWWAAVGITTTVVAVVAARHRSVAVAGVAVVLVATSAVVSWRVVPLVAGPLVPLAGTRTTLDADLVVRSDPATRTGRTSGSRRTDDQWQLDAAILGWRASDGTAVACDLPVRVLTTDDAVADVLPGTRLRASVRVHPGEPLRGRAATLVASSVTVVADAPLVQGMAGAVRSSLRASVAQRPPDQAGLLPGLVVGDTSGVPDDLDRAMRDSSLAHLTAVSGGNVAVIVLLALGVVRAVGVRRGPLQLVLVAAAVAAYVVVARPQPSVVRAAGMTAVVLLALLLDLRVRPLDALGWAVGALVLLDPFLSLSVGFAMSAAATGGLLLLAARATSPPPGSRWWQRAARAVLAVVVVSAVAQVAVAPLVVGIGGGVPVGGVVANLLAAPAVAPATVTGVLAGLVGTLSPPLAALVALPGAWSVGWVATVARTGADLAPPLPWPQGWWGGLALTGALLLAAGGLLVARRTSPWVVRACVTIVAVGGVVAVAPPTPVPLAAAWPPPGWRVVMCDVGQGDALVLSTGPGEAVVVDAGPDVAPVDRCLRRLGVARVPVVVLTHFHADHVEGLAGVLHGRSVGLVYTSPLGEPAGELGRVRGWLRRSGVGMRVAAAGDELRVAGLRLRVLWPARLLRGEGSDANNASIVLLGDVDGVRVLLGGDLETAAQDAVLAGGEVGPVDVVKVPHHGSAKQSPRWARTARPRVALIGVGQGNEYGHPAAATVAAYRAVGTVVGRTDLDGDLAVVEVEGSALGLVRRGR